jgi:hypothetical protein
MKLFKNWFQKQKTVSIVLSFKEKKQWQRGDAPLLARRASSVATMFSFCILVWQILCWASLTLR